MKNSFAKAMTLIVMCIYTFISVAQNNSTGRIIDQQTKEPIIGAVVTNKNQHAISDLNGEFQFSNLQSTDSITISFVGYTSQTIASTSNLGNIELEQSKTQLNQVIISAGRSQQNRSEVPMAMSVISAKELDQTKANSIHQLVNKSPGVFMVNLGNEQHSMAIRQPLSYKSLFLYLEDGIPIRTTGLFNHNALLEMNMSSFKKIEIIRGPSSSLYGSEAIGGAINFITLEPTVNFQTKFSHQISNLGFNRSDLLISNTKNKTGYLLAANHASRRNGFREHSDYDKLSVTGKLNHQFSDKLTSSTSFTLVDYKSDMTGSLDSANFYDQEYSSIQTFTNRDVWALRVKSSLRYYWSDQAKSSFNLYYRNNSIKQNPSYRIKDDYSPWGNPGGNPNLAHSEVNDNSFYTLGAILQHNQKLNWKKTKFTGGLSIDYSPSSYLANYISVYKNNDGIYESFTASDSVLTNYNTNMLNSAGYFQLELEPINHLKVTGALRYDHFIYDYNNHLGAEAFSGAPDNVNYFGALSPKLGLNYNFNSYSGIYANFSQGFVPPQVGELYRGVQVPTLVPAIFRNSEVGSYLMLIKNKLSVDIAYYQLEGLNEIISVRLDNGEYVNQNVGKTNHQGVEYGIRFEPIKPLLIRFSGTNASHTFIQFEEKGEDLANYEMARSPRWIANGEITFTPQKIKGLRIGAEWQHMAPYFMDNSNTKTYDGFDIYHLRVGYSWKSLEAWVNVMNITDELYATNASKSAWGTSYTPGNPRTFTIGLQYHFSAKEKTKE